MVASHVVNNFTHRHNLLFTHITFVLKLINFYDY